MMSFTLECGKKPLAELRPLPAGAHLSELPGLLASPPRLSAVEAGDFDDPIAFACLNGVRVDREATLNGLIEVFEQLLEGLALSGAARYGRDLRPESPFFGLVDYDFQSHAPPPRRASLDSEYTFPNFRFLRIPAGPTRLA
jgi:hypothetical protein